MKVIEEKILFGLLSNPKSGPRNQIISDCPWCGKDKHFYVNKGLNHKGLINPYDCKKCGVSGSIYTLLAKLNSLHLLQGHQIDHDKLTKFDFQLNEENDNFEEYIIENKILPIGSKDLDIEMLEYQYLLTRKFTEIDFELYLPTYPLIS